jgi:hypothetical protein
MPSKKPAAAAEPARRKLRPLNEHEAGVMDRIATRLDRKRNITWTWLAVGCGHTKNMGSQWSSRNSFPKERDLHRIATMLEVDMGWLLTGDDRSEATRAQTQTEAAMLQVMRTLPPDMQKLLLAQAEATKDSLTKK